jgi:hypothetical protein
MVDTVLDGKPILNWIFKKLHDVLVCLKIGTSARVVRNVVMNVWFS